MAVGPGYCGVPQCNTLREPGVSLHKIPKEVIRNKKQLLAWKIALKMGKPFPKTFRICSKHFKKRFILIPFPRGQNSSVRLSTKAFPTENLPQSSITRKRCIDSVKERSKRLEKRNGIDLDIPWNESNENLLIKLLKDREHIYNRNHPNYKTYDVIKECASIASLFEPSKTSKEILDKITSIRNDLAKVRNMIESNNSNLEFPPLFEKCKFMYTALFGEIPSHFLKKKFKYIEFEEKNDSTDLSIIEEKPNSFKKVNLKDLERLLKTAQYDSDISCSENEAETEFTSNSNVFTHFENLTGVENKNILRSIVNFIKDKPFLWDSKHPLFDNIDSSKEILKNFGKTLNPPLSVNLIQYRIGYLRKTFFKSLKYGKKWHLFNDCKFFLTSKKNALKEFPKKEKNYDKMNLHKIIKFIEDKPYLYDIKHPKYNNIKLKKKYLTSLGDTLNPPLSYASLITYINDLRTLFYKNLNKIGDQTTWPWWLDGCKFFLSKDTNNSEEFDEQNTKTIEVIGNCNDEEKSLDELCESFSPKEENSKEIGIQCNLYEELLKDKIQTIQFKECSCYMEILNIIDSFNPIDTNLELLHIKTESISMDKQLTDNENNTIITDPLSLCDEDLNLTKDENEVKWSDFENVSNDDSSDYGLTEIPFPEISKQQKKDEDHIILYECTVCKKEFRTHYLFDMHYTKCHAERSQLCSVCGVIHTSFRKLQNHENHCNPNDNPYCYECKQVFKSKINYFDHYNIKHNKKQSPYVCCCNKSFMKYSKFVFHLNKYNCGSIDLCTIPDYTTKEFLETFLELKSSNRDDKTFTANTDNNTEEEKLKYWCRICKRNFYNNRAYMFHFRQEFHKINEKEWLEEHCIEKVFECELCDKQLSELIDLIEHRVKYHHRQTLDDYIKNLEYAPNWEDQPILITQPTDFSNIYNHCYICKRKFFMQDFISHFKDMEHIVLQKYWLEKHNIEVFNCSNCSIDFESLLEYFTHRNLEHKEWPTNALIKSLKGDTNNSIPDFLRDKINSKLIYKCSLCNYYTPYKAVHIDHMLYHYPDKLIQCSCGKKFITRRLLSHHRNKVGCKKEGCIIPRFVIQSTSFVNANLIS